MGSSLCRTFYLFFLFISFSYRPKLTSKVIPRNLVELSQVISVVSCFTHDRAEFFPVGASGDVKAFTSLLAQVLPNPDDLELYFNIDKRLVYA